MFKKLENRYHYLYDLKSWREWLFDATCLIFFFIMPFNLAFALPFFYTTGHYILIILDVITWIVLGLRSFTPLRIHIKAYHVLALLTVMIAGFFITYGPGYSRPAWFMTLTVLMVIFEGILASLAFIFAYLTFLTIFFFFFTSGNPAWQTALADGNAHWIVFIANIGIQAVLCAISSGLVISRLGSSLDQERKASQEYQATMEELEASNEEFEAINNELLLSQKMLQDSENLYRELAEVLPLIVFKCSTNGMVNYANPRAFEATGYDQADFDRGIPISTVFSETSLESLLESYNRICREKTPSNGEYTVKRKDGSTFPAMIYAAPIVHDGFLVGITGAVMDLTSRIEIEEENRRVHEHLAQAQKMEAIGTLAGGIAHDFNNILTGIIGYTEIARDEAAEEQVKDTLTHVLQFSSRASDLVRQILTLSRKHEHTRIPVHAVSIIKEAAKLLRASLPATISIDISDQSLHDTIIGDPTEMLQVITNLGTNAAHAMREHGGAITINIENSRSVPAPDAVPQNSTVPDQLKITFSDTGCGIPQGVIAKIFDPFYTTKPVGEGTGLGLSITDSIIRDCSGTISVTSRPGKGTTFTITMPLYMKSIDESARIKTETRIRGNGHILVVDDEGPIAYMEKIMLEKLGYTVNVCSSATEGLEAFKADPDSYNLVVTDQTMPRMTGTDLTAEIHKIRPEIPVLLCTGFSDKVTLENYKSFGISSMVYKPVSLSLLSMEVNRLLNNKE